jgi:hypothetical protein
MSLASAAVAVIGGRRSSRPASRDSVLCARKPLVWPCACAACMTWFTAASTRRALRRVWSQLSKSPPSAVRTKSCAATNTCGSARRKR